MLWSVNILEGIRYPVFTKLRTGERKQQQHKIKRNKLGTQEVRREGVLAVLLSVTAVRSPTTLPTNIYKVDHVPGNPTASTARDHREILELLNQGVSPWYGKL